MTLCAIRMLNRCEVVSPDFVRVLQCPAVCWITLQVNIQWHCIPRPHKTAARGVIFSCNKTIEDVGSLWDALSEVFSRHSLVQLSHPKGGRLYDCPRLYTEISARTSPGEKVPPSCLNSTEKHVEVVLRSLHTTPILSYKY